MAKHRNPRRSRQHKGVKIVRLKDGRYVARWLDPHSGKQQQQSLDRLKLTTEDQRIDWAAAKADELATVRGAVAAGIVTSERAGLAATIADYLTRYANPGTQENKRIVLDAFEEWAQRAGVRDVQDLVPVHLARWREHLFRPTTSKHKTSTRNRWLIAVAVFLNWCRRQGLAPMLSSDAVKEGLRREPEPREEIKILRPAELRKMLEAAMRYDDANPWRGASPNVAAFLLLATLTGLRSAELRHLEWGEVDLDAREIRLPASRTKTKQARTIGLDVCPIAVELLRRLKLRTPGALVFPNWTQGRTEHTVVQLRTEFGSPRFSMHTLRRTCGTLTTCAPGIFGGASAYLTAKRLGHAVEISERSYLGLLQIAPAAKTIEAAACIEDVAQQIVERVGGERDTVREPAQASG